MTVTNVIPLPPAVRQTTKWITQCPQCSAIGDAPCECGVPLETLRANIVAAKAIEETPDLSDDLVAQRVGVSRSTVQRARKQVTHFEQPAKRKGRNGLSQSSTKRVRAPNIHQFSKDDHDEPDAVEAANAAIRLRYFNRHMEMCILKADQLMGMRDAKGREITRDVLNTLNRAISAFTALRNELKSRR